MDTILLMWAWIQSNPWTTVAIAAYVIANLSPRPHPEDLSGWQRTFWSTIDGLCLLTAAKVPGRLKYLLANSPAIAVIAPKTVEKPAPEPEPDDDDEDEDDADEDEGDSSADESDGDGQDSSGNDS